MHKQMCEKYKEGNITILFTKCATKQNYLEILKYNLKCYLVILFFINVYDMK